MSAQATVTAPWAFAGLRARPCLAWMGHRATFAIGMPALSLIALASSLCIPRLIGPTEFGTYALLLTLFQYTARGDLGLTQLADRLLAGGGGDEAGRRLLDARSSAPFPRPASPPAPATLPRFRWRSPLRRGCPR